MLLQDSYGIQKLNEAAQKMDFCNRYALLSAMLFLETRMIKPVDILMYEVIPLSIATLKKCLQVPSSFVPRADSPESSESVLQKYGVV